jgi:hypothetical protein
MRARRDNGRKDKRQRPMKLHRVTKKKFHFPPCAFPEKMLSSSRMRKRGAGKQAVYKGEKT